MILDITWLLTAISLTGTVFNIRKKIICFHIWLIGDVCWFILDYSSGVYGRAVLDLIQIILAFCGIYEWKKGGNNLNANRKNGYLKTKSGRV